MVLMIINKTLVEQKLHCTASLTKFNILLHFTASSN